jgi:hypothetical protein
MHHRELVAGPDTIILLLQIPGIQGSVRLYWCPEVCSGVYCSVAELFFNPEQLQSQTGNVSVGST